MTAIKGILAILLAAAIPAAAETVYKYQRPDGKVVYSDSPVEGAKLIGQFDLVPTPVSPEPAAPHPDATGGLAEQREAVLGIADERIKAADRALMAAEERQQQAMEPLPGERRGNVDGRTRLTQDYFARQREAAAAVDSARADLDAAYRLKNEVRE
jgi:hypothetical protein